MSLVSLLLSMIELVDHTNIGETVEDNIHISNLQKMALIIKQCLCILDSISTKSRPMIVSYEVKKKQAIRDK